MEEALFLAKFATKVTIIHRRDSLRASKIMADRAFAHETIDFVWNTIVEEVVGTTHVTGLKVRNLKEGTRYTMPADALFIAIGHDPNTQVFKGQLDLDSVGYIASPNGSSTNVEGVFVAGDVYDVRYKQAVTAAGLGCRAAMDAELFFDVIGIGLDLIDEGGIEERDLDVAVEVIGEEADEELAVEGELGGDLVLTEVHVVIGIVPEAVDELLDLGMRGGDLEAFAEDEVDAHLDDGVGHGIGVIGLIDLVMDFEIGAWEDVLEGPVIGEAAPEVVLFGAGGGGSAPEPVLGGGIGDGFL